MMKLFDTTDYNCTFNKFNVAIIVTSYRYSSAGAGKKLHNSVLTRVDQKSARASAELWPPALQLRYNKSKLLKYYR
jgi:hypothetical protein